MTGMKIFAVAMLAIVGAGCSSKAMRVANIKKSEHLPTIQVGDFVDKIENDPAFGEYVSFRASRDDCFDVTDWSEIERTENNKKTIIIKKHNTKYADLGGKINEWVEFVSAKAGLSYNSESWVEAKLKYVVANKHQLENAWNKKCNHLLDERESRVMTVLGIAQELKMKDGKKWEVNGDVSYKETSEANVKLGSGRELEISGNDIVMEYEYCVATPRGEKIRLRVDKPGPG